MPSELCEGNGAVPWTIAADPYVPSHYVVLPITAQGAVRQVQSHAVRAERLVNRQRDRLREVVDGLSLPLVGLEVSPRHVSSPNGRRNQQRGPGARLPRGCIGRRCASLQGMWSHHDAKRSVLSLRKLRLDKWCS